jgi:hypothetical protein
MHATRALWRVPQHGAHHSQRRILGKGYITKGALVPTTLAPTPRVSDQRLWHFLTGGATPQLRRLQAGAGHSSFVTAHNGTAESGSSCCASPRACAPVRGRDVGVVSREVATSSVSTLSSDAGDRGGSGPTRFPSKSDGDALCGPTRFPSKSDGDALCGPTRFPSKSDGDALTLTSVRPISVSSGWSALRSMCNPAPALPPRGEGWR